MRYVIAMRAEHAALWQGNNTNTTIMPGMRPMPQLTVDCGTHTLCPALPLLTTLYANYSYTQSHCPCPPPLAPPRQRCWSCKYTVIRGCLYIIRPSFLMLVDLASWVCALLCVQLDLVMQPIEAQPGQKQRLP